MDHFEKTIKAFISGDQTAFEEIYKKTYKEVYFTCISFLRNEKDAEDISQEVYLSFLTSASKLEEPAKLKAWLATVAANKCRNYLKKEKPILMEDELMEDLKVATDELLLPEEYVTNQAKRKIVMDIMKEELSEVQYQTVVLFYFNNLSIQEIADIMECPTGTVTYRLSIARDRIKKGIERYEKKSGDKLYSVSFIPILALLFATEAEAMEPTNMCANILAASGSIKKPAVKAVRGGGKAMLSTVKGKLVLFGLFLLVSVGGIATILLMSNQPETMDGESVVSESTGTGENNPSTGETSSSKEKEETNWDAKANTDYFTWSETKITGWSELGLEQTAVIIPAECTEITLSALQENTNLEYLAFEGDTCILSQGVFGNCTNLKEAHLPVAMTEIPHSIFLNCNALEKVVIPNNVTVIKANAFRGCTSLESISLPEGLTTINSGAFHDSGLTSITIPDSVTTIERSAFEGSALKEIQWGAGLEVVDEYVFARCDSLTSITIPANIVTIGEYAFMECPNLSSLTFEENNLEKISKNAFNCCTSLTEVKIPEGVVCIEKDAFSECTGLTNVYIPASVTEVSWKSFNLTQPWTVYVKEGSYADTVEFEYYLDVPVTKAYY